MPLWPSEVSIMIVAVESSALSPIRSTGMCMSVAILRPRRAKHNFSSAAAAFATQQGAAQTKTAKTVPAVLTVRIPIFSSVKLN
jgi:hypothetical protein